MHRRPYVFGYDAEPAQERPTGFGQTAFDLATASTAPAEWQVSEHSTFDAPSRAFERVEAIRRERERTKLVMVAAAVVCAALATALLHMLRS